MWSDRQDAATPVWGTCGAWAIRPEINWLGVTWKASRWWASSEYARRIMDMRDSLWKLDRTRYRWRHSRHRDSPDIPEPFPGLCKSATTHFRAIEHLQNLSPSTINTINLQSPTMSLAARTVRVFSLRQVLRPWSVATGQRLSRSVTTAPGAGHLRPTRHHVKPPASKATSSSNVFTYSIFASAILGATGAIIYLVWRALLITGLRSWPKHRLWLEFGWWFPSNKCALLTGHEHAVKKGRP